MTLRYVMLTLLLSAAAAPLSVATLGATLKAEHDAQMARLAQVPTSLLERSGADPRVQDAFAKLDNALDAATDSRAVAGVESVDQNLGRTRQQLRELANQFSVQRSRFDRHLKATQEWLENDARAHHRGPKMSLLEEKSDPRVQDAFAKLDNALDAATDSRAVAGVESVDQNLGRTRQQLRELANQFSVQRSRFDRHLKATQEWLENDARAHHRGPKMSLLEESSSDDAFAKALEQLHGLRDEFKGQAMRIAEEASLLQTSDRDPIQAKLHHLNEAVQQWEHKVAAGESKLDSAERGIPSSWLEVDPDAESACAQGSVEECLHSAPKILRSMGDAIGSLEDQYAARQAARRKALERSNATVNSSLLEVAAQFPRADLAAPAMERAVEAEVDQDSKLVREKKKGEAKAARVLAMQESDELGEVQEELAEANRAERDGDLEQSLAIAREKAERRKVEMDKYRHPERYPAEIAALNAQPDDSSPDEDPYKDVRPRYAKIIGEALSKEAVEDELQRGERPSVPELRVAGLWPHASGPRASLTSDIDARLVAAQRAREVNGESLGRARAGARVEVAGQIHDEFVREREALFAQHRAAQTGARDGRAFALNSSHVTLELQLSHDPLLLVNAVTQHAADQHLRKG